MPHRARDAAERALIDARAERDNVLVTAVVPYGDDDAVVRLLGANHGRVGAFAKKARASKRRFPALFAPSLGQAWLKSRRGDLLELAELDTDPVTLALAQDPRALGHAAYIAELCERLLPEAEPSADVFALADEALRALCQVGARAVMLRAFELRLLAALGYLPDWTLADADVGSALPATAFESARGPLHHATPAAFPFSEDARLCGVQLMHGPLNAVADAPRPVLVEVSRIFAAHLRQHRIAPLRSVAFLRSLAPG